MKEKTKWVAEDGAEFDSEVECEEYENKRRPIHLKWKENVIRIEDESHPGPCEILDGECVFRKATPSSHNRYCVNAPTVDESLTVTIRGAPPHVAGKTVKFYSCGDEFEWPCYESSVNLGRMMPRDLSVNSVKSQTFEFIHTFIIPRSPENLDRLQRMVKEFEFEESQRMGNPK